MITSKKDFTYKPPKQLQKMQIWSLVVAKTREEKVSEYNLSSCSPFTLRTWAASIKQRTKKRNYADVVGIVSTELLIVDIDVKVIPKNCKALLKKYPTHHHLSKSGNGWKIYYLIDKPMSKKIRVMKDLSQPKGAQKYGELFCGAFVTTTDPKLSDFSKEKVNSISLEQISEFIPEANKQVQDRQLTEKQKKDLQYVDLEKVLAEVKRMLDILPTDIDTLLDIAYESRFKDFEANSYNHWLMVSHALSELAIQLAREYPNAKSKIQLMFHEWSQEGSSYVSEEDCNERFERSFVETLEATEPIVSFNALRKLFWAYRIPVEDFPGVLVNKRDSSKTIDPTDPDNYKFLTKFLGIRLCQEVSQGHFYIRGPHTVIKSHFLNEQFYFLTNKTIGISIPFNKLNDDDLKYRLVSLFRRYGIKGVLRNHPINAGLNASGIEPIDTLYEWISAKPWDGSPRVLKLIEESIVLDKSVIPSGIPHSFFYLLIMKHLVHMAGLRAKAYRVYANKQIHSDRFKKAQGILILAGYQNTHKSTWIECLLPSQASYVKNVTPSSVKDTLEMQRALAGTFALNIDEIDAVLDNINISDFKNVITQDRDSFRVMYSQSFKDHPRAAGFFGTTNKSHLRLDRTGNRRFWIIPIKQCDAQAFVTCDYQQVWAELLYYAENLGIEEWNVTEQEKEYIDKTARHYNKQTVGGKTLDMVFTDDEGESLVFNHTEFNFDYLLNNFPQKLQRLFSKEGLFYPVVGNKYYIHLKNEFLMDDNIDFKLTSFTHEIASFLDNLMGLQNKTLSCPRLTYKAGIVSYFTGKKDLYGEPKPTLYHFIPYKKPLQKLIDAGEISTDVFKVPEINKENEE